MSYSSLPSAHTFVDSALWLMRTYNFCYFMKSAYLLCLTTSLVQLAIIHVKHHCSAEICFLTLLECCQYMHPNFFHVYKIFTFMWCRDVTLMTADNNIMILFDTLSSSFQLSNSIVSSSPDKSLSLHSV